MAITETCWASSPGISMRISRGVAETGCRTNRCMLGAYTTSSLGTKGLCRQWSHAGRSGQQLPDGARRISGSPVRSLIQLAEMVMRNARLMPATAWADPHADSLGYML